MAMTHDRTTDRDPGTMTTLEIDCELAELTTTLNHTHDVELATDFARRRLDLLSAKPLATIRDRVRRRQEKAQAAEAARATFATVEAELVPLMRAKAAEVARCGRELQAAVASYLETAPRLGEVDAALLPAPPKREQHLPQKFFRVTAVVTPIVPAIEAAATVEAQAAWCVQRFFDEARQQLPPAPDPDDGDEPV